MDERPCDGLNGMVHSRSFRELSGGCQLFGRCNFRDSFARGEACRNFFEFNVAGGFHRERVQSELRGGTGEEADAEISQNFALHRILTNRGAIYVRSIGLISNHETFGGHDLQHLEDGGVTRRPFLIEGVINLPHSGRFFLPQNPEQPLEFRLRWGGGLCCQRSS